MEKENEVVKTFAELGVREELVEACERLGWKNPSKIQTEALPYALEGKDIIGLAQTGSGKTGAFAIPILQALLEYVNDSEPTKGRRPDPAFFACVLSQTRDHRRDNLMIHNIGPSVEVYIDAQFNVDYQLDLENTPRWL